LCPDKEKRVHTEQAVLSNYHDLGINFILVSYKTSCAIDWGLGGSQMKSILNYKINTVLVCIEKYRLEWNGL